jgi:ArsR family metal-binding transcriptional regulator
MPGKASCLNFKVDLMSGEDKIWNCRRGLSEESENGHW